MEQREEDLLEPSRVADRDVRHVGGGTERDVEALRARGLRHEGEAAFDRGADVEGVQSELEVAAVQRDPVQDIVHDPGDLFGPGLDDGCQLPLLAGLGPGRQQAGRAHDRVELRAELVTEVGQELDVDLDLALVAVDLAVGRGR